MRSLDLRSTSTLRHSLFQPSAGSGIVMGARYGVERELRIVVESAVVSGVVCAVLLLMPRPRDVGERWLSEVMLVRLPIVEKERRPLVWRMGEAEGEETQGFEVKYSSSMRGLVDGEAVGDGVLASGRSVGVDASM
jgi:hypothetical protein